MNGFDGTAMPEAEQYKTTGQNEPHDSSATNPQPDQQIENTGLQRKLPRLRLVLSKSTQESGTKPAGVRRSLRVSERLTDHGSPGSSDETTLSGKKQTDKKTPPSKSKSSCLVVRMPEVATNPLIDHAHKEKHPRFESFKDMSKGVNAPSQINTGNIDEPIDVDSLPSPPPPHSFANRSTSFHGPLPLKYKLPRPRIQPALLTPNGARILAGRISGPKSHAVYRGYIERRNAPAPPGFTDSCVKLNAEILAAAGPSKGLAPVASMYPTNTCGKNNTSGIPDGQMYASPLQMPYEKYPHNYRTHTYSRHTPIHGYPMYPVLDEKHLRKRAVQFFLDKSRLHSRKRRLSDDPDATSDSEYQDNGQSRKKKPKICERPKTPDQQLNEAMASTPSTGTSEKNMFDRNQKLDELIEHTQLLAAMLINYPRSSDPKGLREDIEMMGTVTQKHLASWVSAEKSFELDTHIRLALADAWLPSDAELMAERDARMDVTTCIATGAAEVQKKPQDDEVKRYMLAKSEDGDDETRCMSAESEDGDDETRRDLLADSRVEDDKVRRYLLVESKAEDDGGVEGSSVRDPRGFL